MLDELIADAELGEEAKRFLESDLGRCIIGMMEQEVLNAQLELETIDPANTSGIIGFQQFIKVARMFPQWLNELLVRGEQAKSAWVQQRSES
jgi:hypothetical protein